MRHLTTMYAVVLEKKQFEVVGYQKFDQHYTCKQEVGYYENTPL